MQLHRLEVEGFGPFRERQIVDFDTFVNDGIFLIAGRTGAGKTSILDAVCFGLYGGVPRYEGGEKRLRSDHCEPDDPTVVVVEFSTAAGRYRVTRSPEYERPKKRGGGMTTQPASVQLDALVGGAWLGLAAKEREAAHELDGILQLSREQFLQVILLAQNRFSEFLLAGSKERQSLLRRLFGTERFENVQARFEERRRAAELTLGARLAAVTVLLDEAERLVSGAALGAMRPDGVSSDDSAAELSTVTTEERVDELRRASARARYRAERAVAERIDAEQRSATADAALVAMREQQRAQRERDRARAALAHWDALEPQIVADRVELEHARAADGVRSAIAGEAHAIAALNLATATESSAAAAWKAHGIDTDELSSWATARTKESGAWASAQELERTAVEREAQLRAAEFAVSEATARIESADAERAALPAQREAISIKRDDARRLADRAADLASSREVCERRLAGAHDVVRLLSEQGVGERALVDASERLTARQETLTQLRRRRLDGFAGELASTLIDGEPCSVCGSLQHPRPATHSDPISAQDIAEAESARDAAAQRERDAVAAEASVRAQLAAAQTIAEGKSVADAEFELAAATTQHTESLAARDLCVQLDAQLQQLAERIEHSETAREQSVAMLAADRESLARLTERAVAAEATISAARGQFDSVAERLEATLVEIGAAQTLIEARAEKARRHEAAALAESERASVLADSPFDDVPTAEAARRPTEVQVALEEKITEHAVQREKERGILLDLELQALPEETISLSGVEQAAQAARASWTAAVDEAARISGIAEQLGGLIDSVDSAQARSAEENAEFEILRGLADTIAGRGANTRKMTLETFVLAAELEEIVAAANRRLSDMSTGRYQLRHSDALAARGAASGLGIVVFDAFTGQTRPAQSLSGGETFLGSLALALGLAEVVTARAGGIRLDTLFIDEGFGSLDGDTLDVAMRTLDELRQGGRTVGVISHVEAMQEQIPAQLSVRTTSSGASVINTR